MLLNWQFKYFIKNNNKKIDIKFLKIITLESIRIIKQLNVNLT